jgi:selenocysteine lyase/cysteine desulfurase
MEKKINELSEYAKKRLLEKNLLDYQVSNRTKHSNIFNLKGDEILYNKLISNKIICSRRGDGIRISLNFYNKIEEIDYLLSFFK